MKNIIAIIILLLPLFTAAQHQKQKTENKNVAFHSILQGGVIGGKYGSSYFVQTVNGVQYKTWFGGVGFGFDKYYPRSLPLFGEIRKDLFNKPSTAFAFADFGSHILIDKKTYGIDISASDNNAKLYYNLGAGYKLNIAKKFSLLFSSSYSIKEYSQKYTIIYPCYSMGPCPETSNKTDYVLHRLSLQVGFMF